LLKPSIGKWQVFTGPLESKTWHIAARAYTDAGAKSEPSEMLSLTVEEAAGPND